MFALDLLNQFQSYNGTLLAAGKIYVYKLGRTELAPVYGDHNGATVIANPVILDDQGMAEIYLNDAFNYTIVVFDAYGQEQFSRDIYPSGMGKGESIGTQLYEGIDPIVVNNDIYAISANTTKLGVQDPLYFVQDDAERVIIGFSGHTDVPEGTMNESAFGYEAGQITSYNGSAFSAGLNYQAGDNIVINGNEIALDSAITLVDQSHTKGMQLDATEQQFTNLTSNNGSILDASGLYVSDLNMENAANLSKDGLYVTGTGSRISMSNDMSDIYGEHHFEIYGYQESGDGVSAMHLGGNDLIVEHGENGFITASYSLTGACQSAVSALNTITATSGNYYPMEGNPSGFLTAHQDISDKLDTTAFSTVSGDFLTAVPSEYVTENTLQSGLSSKLDSTAFSTVSGDFLTAHQSLDGLMSADLLEISDNKITGYNGTAFAGQGGGVSGDYELSAGSGISIVDYPLEQKTVISVTAQGGNPEVEQAVIDNSATWETVTAKQDSLTFGYHDTVISSIDNSALYDNSAHARINTLAGRISDLSSNKLDTTAFSDVSGTFLTAHQDLSDYQTTAGMTAYQEAGDYYSASNPSGFITGVDLTPYQLTADMTAYQPVGDYYSASNPSGFITGLPDEEEVEFEEIDLTDYQPVSSMTAYQPIGDYLTTGDSANFYTTANESGYLTAVPDTYLQNTDLSTEDGKVTAISGIPLSAGGDVPEGVMVESAVGYNAVNEISGYNGSAIAQYGAEKQWLVHDDTLVHAANSAQYALGVNVSAVAQLLGVDETVLWSGELSVGQTAALTENYSAFRKLEFKYRPWSTADNGQMKYEQFGTEYGNWQTLAGWMKNNLKAVFIGAYSATDDNHITLTSACFNNITATNAWANASDNYRLFEIRGIGRKQ